MVDKHYNPKEYKSILDYANKMIENRVCDIIEKYDFNINKNKGKLGQLIEEEYFGIRNNSEQEPDFKEVGVELKVTPLKKLKNGEYRSKERLSLSKINFNNDHKFSFYDSHLYKKINHMLIIAYLYDKKLPIEEFVIKGVIDFKIPEEDIATIIEDYNFIIQKIKDGKAHELSEGQTNYLGASSTGASSSDRTSQPFNELESKPRRWSFKNSYMNNIIGKYFKKKEYVSIKSNSEKSLEQYVFEKIKPFRNLTEAEIKSKLGLNYKVEAKNGIHILASGMLGIKGSSLKNLGKTEEFLKANIKLKTIRILKSMKLKEDMSFKNIKFNEISQVENFEDSEMYEVFSETRYLLFLMLEDENGEFRFNNVKFWAMNSEEIEEIKKLRIKIKKALKEGIRADTSSSRYVYENLPTSQKDSWAHIRTKGPGGEGPRNFEVLDDGSKIRKHCVFIGKSHVMKIIEDSIIIY